MPQSSTNLCVCQGNKNYSIKIHLFLFQNTNQTNISIFLNKAWENFNLAKSFCKVRVRI